MALVNGSGPYQKIQLMLQEFWRVYAEAIRNPHHLQRRKQNRRRPGKREVG
jgi:hypothetical protein